MAALGLYLKVKLWVHTAGRGQKGTLQGIFKVLAGQGALLPDSYRVLYALSL